MLSRVLVRYWRRLLVETVPGRSTETPQLLMATASREMSSPGWEREPEIDSTEGVLRIMMMTLMIFQCHCFVVSLFTMNNN